MEAKEPSTVSPVLEDGDLLAYYEFNRSTDGMITDFSGNENHADYLGGVMWGSSGGDTYVTIKEGSYAQTDTLTGVEENTFIFIPVSEVQKYTVIAKYERRPHPTGIYVTQKQYEIIGISSTVINKNRSGIGLTQFESVDVEYNETAVAGYRDPGSPLVEPATRVVGRSAPAGKTLKTGVVFRGGNEQVTKHTPTTANSDTA